MRLYDNDAYREEFMALVYELLMSDETNDRANQIISAFDMAPEVEAEPLKPNDPLTMEELREMDGEPVWLEYDQSWSFVVVDGGVPMLANLEVERCKAENWIGLWGNIYRRKPEDV